MAEAVYAICALTGLVCAVLLFRSYGRSRTPLLLWSGLCFAGLTLNNVILFADLVVFPAFDLSLWRGLTSVGSLLILLFRLIWDAK
jgi:hypothetical protein